MGLFSKIKKKVIKPVLKPINKATEKLTFGLAGGVGDLAKKAALATAGFFGLKALGPGLGSIAGPLGGAASSAIPGAAGSSFLSGIGSQLFGAGLQFAGDWWANKQAKDAYTPPEVDWTGAKHGIRWRVADAKAAGIHPLYALGAPGVGSGAVIGGHSEPSQASTYQNLGQNLAYMTSQRAQLSNALLAAQIAKLDAETKAIAGSPPLDTSAVPFRGSHVHELFKTEDGFVKRTSQESRMDISEAIGPGVDAWIQNPDKRREIEQTMVNNLLDLPVVRHAKKPIAKARAIVARELDKSLDRKLGGKKWNDPTPFQGKSGWIDRR